MMLNNSLLLPLLLTVLSSAAASPVVFTRRQQGNAPNYPPAGATPPRSMTPQSWIDALNAAHAAGKIPDIPQSLNRDGPLAYPAGVDPASPSVCNWSWNQCEGPNDIHTAPHGEIAMNFDDGPAGGTDQLLGFLQSNNQRATHFLIGGNIFNNQGAVRQMAQSNLHHMAVHTWSHPSYISSLSNEDIVAELGWTSEIIFQLTGKVPKYWRAPQGDADNRVRAIAENVFGLTLAGWNADSNDWRMAAGQSFDTTCGNIWSAIQTLPAQGQGVLMLEHELTGDTVNAFQQCTWPALHQANLQAMAVGDLTGQDGWYANANDNTSPTSGQSDILSANSATTTSSSVVTSSSTMLVPATATATATAAPTHASQSSVPVLTVTASSGQLSNHQASASLPSFTLSSSSLFTFVFSAAALSIFI